MPRRLTRGVCIARSTAHGTRAAYRNGCRCLPCRRANAAYALARKRARANGGSNRVIDATPARLHIWKLSRAGVGRRSIAEAARLPLSTVQAIKKGRQPRCREETVRRILLVTSGCRADRSLVPAASCHRKITRLVDEGYQRGALGRMLGCRASQLRLGKYKVTARTRAKVDRIYSRLMT